MLIKISLVLSLIAPIANVAGAATGTVATVDGEPVTAEALERAAISASPYGKKLLASPVARRQTLDHLIETKILARVGRDLGLEKDPAYQARLEEARLAILASLAVDRHVASHAGEKAVQAYFAKDPTRFGSKEIKANHIIVTDEVTARKVLAAAKAPNADFAALSKQYGTGPGAEGGGVLGWFRRGRMLPEFEKAAFATPKGQVYPEPVKTSFGYHIIKVEDVRGVDDAKLADVRDQVKEALEVDLRQTYLTGLKAKAKVVIDETALERAGK